MRTRMYLDDILRTIIGNGNVYFQPGTNVTMKYPCIRYSLYDILNDSGDNLPYKQHQAYQVILIDPNPDNEFWEKIAALPMCNFDRYYVAENLNHYVYTIYI